MKKLSKIVWSELNRLFQFYRLGLWPAPVFELEGGSSFISLQFYAIWRRLPSTSSNWLLWNRIEKWCYTHSQQLNDRLLVEIIDFRIWLCFSKIVSWSIKFYLLTTICAVFLWKSFLKITGFYLKSVFLINIDLSEGFGSLFFIGNSWVDNFTITIISPIEQ